MKFLHNFQNVILKKLLKILVPTFILHEVAFQVICVRIHIFLSEISTIAKVIPH